jgi:tetratricopeptide (TPR) repeat protein
MSYPALAEAIARHQQGHLHDAERLYRNILSHEPDEPDALHLLGVVSLQFGQVAQAIELIEKAIARYPSVAAFHANLAEAYRAAGQLERAAACCQLALRLQPAYPTLSNNFGTLLMHLHRPAEAAEQFRLAVTHQPDYALAHNNLGNAYRVLGDLERSIAHFRRAVELDPLMGFAHGNLGQMLVECNQLQEAEFHCREAVRLQPQLAPARNNLGNLYRKLNDLTQAKACYAEALRLAPNMGVVINNMGEVLHEEGKLDDAERWLHQALELEPNSARFHTSLARLLLDRLDLITAESHLRSALHFDPQHQDARILRGKLCARQGRLDESRAEFSAVLQSNPTHPSVNCQLGNVLMELNQRDEALACFRAALRGNPRHMPALAQLASYLGKDLPAEEEKLLQELVADPGLPEAPRSIVLFALAHVFDARSEYDRAAEYLERANAIDLKVRRERGDAYNPDAHSHFVDRLMNVFTPAFFERVRGFGLDSERPIFIVGLPRSGTTLLEQVLASHSRVFGAGELRLAREGFEALGRTEAGTNETLAFDRLEGIDAGTVRRLAQSHLDKLQTLNDTAARVTDKMPDNYLYLGLLAVLFPRARFIHCRRDMRDVATSCWITQFQAIPWANDPGQIASRFVQYRRVMAHWRRVLPVKVLDVDYEQLVEDFEATARQIVAFCGLDWEAGCLEFHNSRRPVHTASITQVRQPLYRRSVARWKNYETTLRPLFAQVGAAAESESVRTLG